MLGMDYYAILNHGILMRIGNKWYASQSGKAIPVTVVEVDENPTHWGWLRRGEDMYSLVWYDKNLFEMCFPWGSKHEEDAGRGRVCRLQVEIKNG